MHLHPHLVEALLVDLVRLAVLVVGVHLERAVVASDAYLVDAVGSEVGAREV